MFLIVLLIFFFKQKTAYEMRISDWSSDVCSSDLDAPASEHAFGDDDDVARLKADIRLDLAALDKVGQAQRIFVLFAAALVEADQPRLVARRIFAEAADRDHRVEHCHIGDRKSTRLNSSH